MFCSRCGKELPENAVFCNNCGSRVKADEPAVPFGTDSEAATEYPQEHKTGLIIALCAAGALVLAGIVIGVFYLLNNRGLGKKSAYNELVSPQITMMQSAEPFASPEPSATPASMPKRTPSFVLPTEEPVPADVPVDDLLNYFSEIAFDSYDYVIKRWEQPIRLQMLGDYTEEDIENLVYHAEILNSMGTLPEISFVDSGGNFFVYYVPQGDFDEIFTDYNADYTGYYNYTWDDSYQLVEFTMAAATDENTQEDRNHLVLEMLMRGLGVLGYSKSHPESILHYDSCEETFSEIDYYVIYMMYSPNVTSGMDASTAIANLAE